MHPRMTRSACLLALVAIAGTGCRDNAAPTAAVPTRAVAAIQAAAKPRPRAPYISNLQLSSIYVSLSGGYPTPFTVTVTNPSQKDAQTIRLNTEVRSMNNQPPIAASFIAYCPLSNGVVPRGDCTMSGTITGGVGLAPGPGLFTLTLVQQQPDGTTTVLDSKSLDIELRQY